jgi:DNA polymerase III subunit beta
MFIQFKTKEILEGLKKVEKVLPKSSSIEVLKLIKICANEKEIVFMGSDSSNSVEVKIPVDGENITVEKTGGVLLPRTFIEILKRMGSSVTMNVNSKFEAVIKSADPKINVEMRLHGQDPDNYPSFPDIDGSPNLVLNGVELSASIAKTTFAVSQSHLRPILQGVLFQLKDGELLVTATDSHRLARVVKEVNTTEDLGTGAVVPGESLNELKKIIEDEEDVEIFFTESQFVARTKTITFYSRMLEGTYPDVSRILIDPEKAKLSFKANRSELIHALERILVLLEPGKRSVTTIEVKGQELIIENNKKENGSAKETIFITDVSGDEMKLSFDTVYVLQALEATESKVVKFCLTGELTPFTIYPENDVKNQNLILPVRTY